MTSRGAQKVSLSNILFVPDASISILSVPAMNRQDIDVPFMRRSATFYDLRIEFSII